MINTVSFKAVLFDLDGTLLDTLEDIASAMNTVLASRGFTPHPIDSYRLFVGDGMKTLVRRTLPSEHSGNLSLIMECLSAMREEYSRTCYATTRPYPGIPSLLSALQNSGLKLSVFSNKPDDFTRDMTARYFPDIPFHSVMGLRDGVPKKPAPDGALIIAQSSGISPECFFYLGDTATDMKTALSAGMFAAGAGWGFRDVKELWENGALAVFENPGDVLKFIVEH